MESPSEIGGVDLFDRGEKSDDSLVERLRPPSGSAWRAALRSGTLSDSTRRRSPRWGRIRKTVRVVFSAGLADDLDFPTEFQVMFFNDVDVFAHGDKLVGSTDDSENRDTGLGERRKLIHRVSFVEEGLPLHGPMRGLLEGEPVVAVQNREGVPLFDLRLFGELQDRPELIADRSGNDFITSGTGMHSFLGAGESGLCVSRCADFFDLGGSLMISQPLARRKTSHLQFRLSPKLDQYRRGCRRCARCRWRGARVRE